MFNIWRYFFDWKFLNVGFFVFLHCISVIFYVFPWEHSSASTYCLLQDASVAVIPPSRKKKKKLKFYNCIWYITCSWKMPFLFYQVIKDNFIQKKKYWPSFHLKNCRQIFLNRMVVFLEDTFSVKIELQWKFISIINNCFKTLYTRQVPATKSNPCLFNLFVNVFVHNGEFILFLTG